MPDSKFNLEEFIAAWIDGRLDAEGSQVLQQALRDSAEARSQFRRYAQLDAVLHEVADTSGMLGPGEQVSIYRPTSPATPAADAGQRQPQVAVLPTTSERVGLAGWGRVAGWYAAVAVGVLLAISLYGYLQSARKGPAPIAQRDVAVDLDAADDAHADLLRKPPAPVATLSLATEAVWSESQLVVGEAIREGETVSLQQGRARISVGCGAEIVADAPCSLSFLSRDRVRLHRGRVAVDVAPWAKGFTVVTNDMNIVDLGTTFTVSATPGKTTEAAVLKGVVRVHSSKAGFDRPRGLLVTEGQQISIDDKGLFDNVELQDAEQLFRKLDFGVGLPYRPVAMNNSGLGLSIGDEDLHWRVIAGPEESFDGPQFATVCPPERGYLPNYPNTSQWISISNWQTAVPNSVYTFQTEFDLVGYDLGTMQLFGRFLADNGILAVRVNGQPVQVNSWVDNVKYQPFGDRQFRFVNVTEGLVDGRNVIEIDVRNGMMRNDKAENPPMKAIPNPMALRVEWYAFGRHHVLVDDENSARLLRAPQGADLSRFLLKPNLLQLASLVAKQPIFSLSADDTLPLFVVPQ